MDHRGVTSKNEYHEVTVLGKGCFGRALLVRRKGDAKELIVKEVYLEALHHGGKRVIEEAEQGVSMLLGLRHPNLVPFYSSFHEKDTLFLVMEYCQQGDLQREINARNEGEYFEESDIANWTCQLMLGLTYLHSQHILHGDVKPSNAFLSSDRKVAKLADFGIAKLVEETGSGGTSRWIGIPNYTSPECCDGHPYTAKSDAWSLGIVAYYLASLKLPFPSHVNLALYREITTKDPAPLPRYCSIDFQDLIMRLLVKDSENRLGVEEALSHPALQPHHSEEGFDSYDQQHVKMPDSNNNGQLRNNLEEVYLEMVVESKVRGLGESPLHLATRVPHNLEVVKFLINNKGSDVQARDINYETPLHFACRVEDNLEVVKFLVEDKGADVHARHVSGWTPLHFACIARNNLEVVRFLINEQGADVNARANDGWTPLHHACWAGHNLEVVQFLVEERGANVRAVNNIGRTPVDIAKINGADELIPILEH